MKNVLFKQKEDVLGISSELQHLTDEELSIAIHAVKTKRLAAVNDAMQWMLIDGFCDELSKEARKRVNLQQPAFNQQAMHELLDALRVMHSKNLPNMPA